LRKVPAAAPVHQARPTIGAVHHAAPISLREAAIIIHFFFVAPPALEAAVPFARTFKAPGIEAPAFQVTAFSAGGFHGAPFKPFCVIVEVALSELASFVFAISVGLMLLLLFAAAIVFLVSLHEFSLQKTYVFQLTPTRSRACSRKPGACGVFVYLIHV
jgi:hypothetical protein